MNRLSKFAACMSLAVAAQVAYAATERVGGYTWTYYIKGNGAEIYDCCSECAVSPCPTGAVTIPSTLGGKPVKRIGDRVYPSQQVFAGCNRITSVIIPSSVTGISAGAFAGCEGVMSYVVANGNPSYKSVRGLLLTRNGKTLVSGVNGKVAIPNGVKSIGSSAFAGRSGLKSVKIPNSVTSIGGSAFSGCSGLKSVKIPNRVTSIGDWAFAYCSKLTNVEIPNRVTSIDGWAFCGCSRLASVKIPNSVTSMGGWAFSECSRLKSIIFDGNAPMLEALQMNQYYSVLPIATEVKKNCTVYVRRDSSGWGVDIPGEWHGLRIKYIVYRTVNFNANGGTVSTTSRKVENGESVGTLPKASRKGYKFKGWYTKKSGGSKVKTSTKVKKSVTYYAHWTAKNGLTVR